MDIDRYPPIRVWPALLLLAVLAGANAVGAQEPAPSTAPKSVEDALGLSHAQRVLIQQSLAALGFDVGSADGIFGVRSRRGIRNWQAARGEITTEYLDAQAAETLLKGASAAALNRQEHAAEEVKKFLAEALTTVPSIEPGFFRHIAYTAIAEGQAKAGDIKGARRSVREALVILRGADLGTSSQADRIRAIAESQAKGGDIHGALDTARSIKADFYRVNALSIIAETQAKAGDAREGIRSIREALAITRRIENETSRAHALVRIATAQAETGDIHGAHRSIGEVLSIVPTISYVDVRARMLAGIAEAQATMGDTRGADRSMSEALSMVRNTNDAFARSVILRYIAEGHANMGDMHGAARPIGEALGNALRIEKGFSRDSELRDIAETQTKAPTSTARCRPPGASREDWIAPPPSARSPKRCPDYARASAWSRSCPGSRTSLPGARASSPRQAGMSGDTSPVRGQGCPRLYGPPRDCKGEFVRASRFSCTLVSGLVGGNLGSRALMESAHASPHLPDGLERAPRGLRLVACRSDLFCHRLQLFLATVGERCAAWNRLVNRSPSPPMPRPPPVPSRDSRVRA